jgi:D-beta-D-heptose 7-phosphate kinase/D-beta-D-heptose 1-phosphate adenosyltransferase
MSKGLPQPRIRELLRRFAKVRLLVVGDLMLDEFLWGTVERISPEAPVPVVRVERESVHLGGAANVVANARALGARVTACGLVGCDAAGEQICTELRRIGAASSGVVRSPELRTTRKTRVIAHHQQVVRFDREERVSANRDGQRLAGFLERNAARFDAVLVSDYGKGVVSPLVLEVLRERRAQNGFHLVIDPKKPNFAHYRGAELVTPNFQEACDAAGVEGSDEASLRQIGQALLARWEAEAVLVTRGEKGMSLFRRGRPVRHFPALARDVFDVTGAGDTVVATCTVALAAGATLEEAAWLANHAAGVAVSKLGTATVSREELWEAVRAFSSGKG